MTTMTHTRAFQAFCVLAVGFLIGRWTATIDRVLAQAPSKKPSREILIGNVPIHIGDQEDLTLNALSKQYRVLDRGRTKYGAEFFVITGREPSWIVGNVSIQQGRVVDVTKQWADITFPPEVLVSFFQKVYGALESASSETQMGVLSCRTVREPNSVLTTALLDFNGRTSSLNLVQREVDGQRYSEITVDESLTSFVVPDEVPFRIKAR